MKASVAQALADALEHHRRGRLGQAEAGYRQVLARAPDEPDALHQLAMITHQHGRHDAALELIDRAIEAAPGRAAYRHTAGLVLHALGRVDGAIARYREAIALEPRLARAWNGLGIALKDHGALDEATESFRRALSLDPESVAARNNLANALRRRGEAGEAVRLFHEALARRADSPDLWCNLGNALADAQQYDEAVRAYAQAIVLRPGRDAFAGLGTVLLALGRHDDAAVECARALALGETPDVVACFVGALAGAPMQHVLPEVRQMAVRALEAPFARPATLAAACLRLIAANAGVRACIDRAWRAWPARLGFDALFGADAGAVFADSLLRALLACTPICDLAMERFLTTARAALLGTVPHGRPIADPELLAFASALARQCFVNDYVFAVDDDELAAALALRAEVEAALARGEAPAPLCIAVVAAYFPLHAIAHAEALEPAADTPLAALVRQQVQEPRDERARRARIARLSPIAGAVSASVREQYEEHPYPRWLALPAAELAAAHGASIPETLAEAAQNGELDVLVAGCGTGQESIEIAQAFPRARVLALDLSLASLAYAERKAHEMGIANVEHAQADIEALGALGRTFDVVTCVGVLHHLADPLRGFRTLASLLRAGGHMQVGLYSERGRRDVVAAKAFIAKRAYRPGADDIRRCRQELMAVDAGARFAPLAARSDFYVTGECRDLLFHVEEHRFTLPRIRGDLDTLGLRFAGFVTTPAVAARYRERYPGDAAMTDLASWDAFEEEFPDTFAGMYVFWVRNER